MYKLNQQCHLTSDTSSQLIIRQNFLFVLYVRITWKFPFKYSSEMCNTTTPPRVWKCISSYEYTSAFSFLIQKLYIGKSGAKYSIALSKIWAFFFFFYFRSITPTIQKEKKLNPLRDTSRSILKRGNDFLTQNETHLHVRDGDTEVWFFRRKKNRYVSLSNIFRQVERAYVCGLWK